MAERLPIYDIEQEIVDRLRTNRRLILQAPTGSGKSTQVPQILLRQGLLNSGQVIVLQPRRLAARLLATRVAAEQGVKLGQEVGYQVRFEHVATDQTRIKYVTEGILLRQMIQDPELQGVQALVLDEFHERHLYGDITLARALELQQKSRPDLMVIVMSATLPADTLADYLQPCAVLTSDGRTFPVETEYLAAPPDAASANVWDLAGDAFSKYVSGGERGDVLVFMPGGYEIQQTIEVIRRRPESKGYVLLPLHGELPAADQDAAVARQSQPKVVVATNVAETSLTIEGIHLVIDSGLARIPRYDAHRGINTLLVEKISQASADQRTGRAGRTRAGRCLRLWTQAEHSERAAFELPEVKRLDLAEVALTLKSAGVADLKAFRWLEPPADQSLRDAETLLTDLGALDASGAITETGRKMLAFPAHPRYARMLLAAQGHQCVQEACLVAALTQGRDLLIRNPGKDVDRFREDTFGDKASSDFWILMRAWNYARQNEYRIDACRKAGIHAHTARQVAPLLDHFIRIAEREGLQVNSKPATDDALQRCILIGFSDRVGRRLDSGTLRCELVHGRRGALARESVVQQESLLVVAEVREVSGAEGSTTTLFSLATAVKVEWLRELFPSDVRALRRVYYDAGAKRVCAEETVSFRGLTLVTKAVEPPPRDEATKILAEEVLQGRLPLKNWDHEMDQWLIRLSCLVRWCPELGLPPLTDDDRRYLVEQVCQGGVSYRDIKERDVKTVIRSWLSAEQQGLLDQHAPERLSLPNGRNPKVTYVANGEPYVAMRVQELFGNRALPKIAMDRVPMVLHVLAPNMRPVQITQDLTNFWKEHYPRLKQELQKKYPKHDWR